MENYLNIIQIIAGVIGLVLIFIGFILSFKKLDKNNSSTRIPKKTVIISCLLMVIGLIVYAIVKTCTNYSTSTNEDGILMIYLASLVDVFKFYGFIILIPPVLNIRPKQKRIEDSTEKD